MQAKSGKSSRRPMLIAAAALAGLSASCVPAMATSNTWSATASSGVWDSAGNWTGGVNVPGDTGITSGFTNADTATFNNAGNGQTTITLAADRNIKNILFDTAAAASYTIGASGGSVLQLTNSGSITMNSTIAQPQVINADLAIEGTAYSIVDNVNLPATATLTLGGNIAGAAAGATVLTVNAAGGNGTVLLNGVVSDGASSSMSLLKTGLGFLTLNNAGNSFTGSVTATGGTINFASGALTSASSLSLNSTTLVWTGTNADDITDGGTRTVSFGSTGASFNVAVGTNVVTLGAFGNGGTGGFQKLGSGTLALTQAAGWTGATTLAAGTLIITNGNQVSANTLLLNASLFVNGVANLATGTNIAYGNGQINGTGSLTVNGKFDETGSKSVNNVVLGGLTLNGNVYLNTVTAANSTLSLTGNNAATSYTINGVVADYDPATATSGTGNLIASTSGIVTLANASNTYSGITTLTSGILAVSSLADGGSVSSLGQSSSAATNLVLNGGTLRYIGAAASSTNRLFTIGGNVSFDGSGTVPGSSSVTFASAAAITYTSSGTARTLTFTGTNADSNTFDPQITNNGAGAITVVKAGVGTWAITGANTYTGVTSINGGTLVTSSLANGGSASNMGQSTNVAGNLVIATGGTLQYTGGAVSSDRLFTIGAGLGATIDASGTGALNLTNPGAIAYATAASARTFTLTGTNTGNNTLAAILANSMTADNTTLVKNGAGTWILTGANTYRGTTTVNDGTLIVGPTGKLGTTAAASVIVASGGALELSNSASIDDAATLSVSSAATPNIILDTGVNEKVGFLVLDGTNMGFGTYGATGSSAANINDTFFSGGGELTVLPEPASLSIISLGGLAALRRKRRRA